MANDDDMPGFIEDDAPQKQGSNTSGAPAAFNPFADLKVQPTKSGAPAPAPAEPGRAKAAAAAPIGEVDIKPGAGKDLWSCPHCGARNKPQRETCRSCDKSPDEEVIVPWMKKPAARFGIPAGVVALLLLVVIATCSSGLKLVPAELENVDSAVRFGGASSLDEDLGDGRHFVASRRLAVCGRILGSESSSIAGLTKVVLALGDVGRQRERFDETVLTFDGGEAVTRPEATIAVLHLVPGANAPSLAHGQLLSLIADQGEVRDDSGPVGGAESGHVIKIREFLQ